MIWAASSCRSQVESVGDGPRIVTPSSNVSRHSANAASVSPAGSQVASAEPLAFDKGREALWNGELDLALELLHGVPEEHGDYVKAQRMIGREIHTRHHGQPLAGIPYVNRAFLADPTAPNVWQDTWRTYAHAVGVKVH